MPTSDVKMQTIARHLFNYLLTKITPTTKLTSATTEAVTTPAIITREKEEDYLNKIRSSGKKRRKQTTAIAKGSPRDPVVNNQLAQQQQQPSKKMRPNNRIQFPASHQLNVRGTMLSTVAIWAVLLLPQLVSSCRADDTSVSDESFANGKSDNPLLFSNSAPLQQFTSAYPTRGYGDSSDLLYNDPLNTLSSTGANYNPVTGEQPAGQTSSSLSPVSSPAGMISLQNKNRRSSDDHDDDRDDNDDIDDRDDEDQSSSNRVNDMTYDPNNPPFGESTQAAKEREDVEKFFDNHLGPTEEMTPQLTGNEMSAMNTAGGQLMNNNDMETAATSPLSVLSSMLFGRPRPTIISASSGAVSSSSLSPIGSSSMWSGSSAYDEPSPYHHSSSYGPGSSGSAAEAPPSAASHYSSGVPVQSAASNYYNDEAISPGASSMRDIGYSGAGNRSPYHHHSSIHYSRYPSHGGADYSSGYNPSLAAQASETGRYQAAARGKPAGLPPHNYHSHYPHQAHHYNNKPVSAGGYQSSRPYGQQQSAYTSMSHDDNISASGRAPYHQTHRDRYSSMARPAASNSISYNNPEYHNGYGQQPSGRIPTAYQYNGRGNPKYYNQAELYQEQSTYNNGFTIPNEMRANLISPYPDATTIHGDRALVESLLDYPSSQTTTIATNNNKPASAATKLISSTKSNDQLDQQQQQQEQLSSGSHDAGATGSGYDTMIVSGKPFDRPLDQLDRFNINRDDLLTQLAGGSGQSHADQPQATASQPTISNNNGQQRQQQHLNDTITSSNNNGQQNNNDVSQAEQVKSQQTSPSSNNAALSSGVNKGKRPYIKEEWHNYHHKLAPTNNHNNSNRVRREDNEAENDDDDAGWIDEDDNLDDDNDQKQQSSSNLNEQSRDPSRYDPEDNGETTSPHGYELSPDNADLSLYGAR